MGNSNSKKPIILQNLVFELSGKLLDKDYLGKSCASLEEFRSKEQSKITKENDNLQYCDLQMIFQILKPENPQVHNGYVKGKDGSWFLQFERDFGSCTGDMLDWWTLACDESSLFQLSHPFSNQSCRWEPRFYNSLLRDRKPGYYIDFQQTVVQIINNKKYLFSFKYDRPSKHFDTSLFHVENITACLCTRIYMYDKLLGWVGIGYVINIVKETNQNKIIQSRFWIGHYMNKIIYRDFFCHPILVNSLCDTKLYRSIRFSKRFIHSLWIQAQEQVECLKGFLPSYYHNSIAAGSVFEKSVNDPELGLSIPIRNVENNQEYVGKSSSTLERPTKLFSASVNLGNSPINELTKDTPNMTSPKAKKENVNSKIASDRPVESSSIVAAPQNLSNLTENSNMLWKEVQSPGKEDQNQRKDSDDDSDYDESESKISLMYKLTTGSVVDM